MTKAGLSDWKKLAGITKDPERAIGIPLREQIERRSRLLVARPEKDAAEKQHHDDQHATFLLGREIAGKEQVREVQHRRCGDHERTRVREAQRIHGNPAEAHGRDGEDRRRERDPHSPPRFACRAPAERARSCIRGGDELSRRAEMPLREVVLQHARRHENRGHAKAGARADQGLRLAGDDRTQVAPRLMPM